MLENKAENKTNSKDIVSSNLKVPTKIKRDTSHKMRGAIYRGKKNIEYGEVFMPMVTDTTDAVVKITATTICGSDLHLYNGEINKKYMNGYIIGHEAVGVVSSIGSEVKNLKIGDRVVISAVIACGQCDFCKREEMSLCNFTNISKEEEEAYGHCTGGLFGYSELFGGYDGLQAEYARVPFADVNLFKIPDNISDKQALMISDVACTGYHGNELADVKEGDNVVVFGCGPVGLMAQMWAKQRKANNVIAIDIDEQRLNFAKTVFKVQTINSKTQDPVEIMKSILPSGPDKVIDCVGFRFPQDFLHKFERFLKLESDAPNIVNAAIKMVRKCGTIALIGDYFGFVNHFNIGGLMEKHLTLRGGQLWPHKYYKKIFELIQTGVVDPSVIITHTYPLSQIKEVYDLFNKHEQGIIKTLILPDSQYKL
jgi:threonine dehydrogenase-like Zn-dependent dehydrogenase